MSTHVWKVTKITRTRIHATGFWWAVKRQYDEKEDRYVPTNESCDSKNTMDFSIETGRFARKGGNASFAITSINTGWCYRNTRGLTKEQFTADYKDHVSKVPWNEEISAESLYEKVEIAWKEYRMCEVIAGFRKE